MPYKPRNACRLMWAALKDSDQNPAMAPSCDLGAAPIFYFSVYDKAGRQFQFNLSIDYFIMQLPESEQLAARKRFRIKDDDWKRWESKAVTWQEKISKKQRDSQNFGV